MESPNLKIKEIMAFVPSGKDYEQALRFYLDLGFEADFKSDDLALLRMGAYRFFLQKFENAGLQGNFMMNMEVENLDDWWARIESLDLKERYPGTRLKGPTTYPWGKREIHLIDPAGVLWHIAVPAKASP
jgi:catechol 2,3-dioxygenase-like lactoylglutathione lyase family enzyme